MTEHVIGAMSGTSTDGVDVVALRVTQGHFDFVGLHSVPMPTPLASQLLALQQVPWPAQLTQLWSEPTTDPLTCMLLARRDLSELYASAVQQACAQWGLNPSNTLAVGVHGQTLRHRPDLGFTYQTLDAALVAQRCQLPVVHDFRSADVALGGQGAPLVPAFHQHWLAAQGYTARCAVLNLGGFSNLTVLNTDGQVLGGDCGPANVWLDHWARLHWNQAFDHNGMLADSAELDPRLLQALEAHPFLSRPWPKSTGRDDFDVSVLNEALHAVYGHATPDPAVVMATLAQMAANAVVACLARFEPQHLWLAGGGAFNASLVRRLQQGLPHTRIDAFAQLGLPEMAVEAAAFAWLAWARLNQLPGNAVAVTGATRPAVLGSVSLPA